jgi:hypothetical protein
MYARARRREVREKAAEVSPKRTYLCKEILSFTKARNPWTAMTKENAEESHAAISSPGEEIKLENACTAIKADTRTAATFQQSEAPRKIDRNVELLDPGGNSDDMLYVLFYKKKKQRR